MAFLVPGETYSDPQLVGFHLSISMGRVESAPLFCAAKETIEDTANNTMHKRVNSPVQLLEISAETLPGDRYHFREGK